MANPPINENVGLDHIFLDPENPRHKPFETEREVIDYLCRHENVRQLAQDIVENGLNPLERFALIPDGNGLNNDKPMYFVAEGNRRICALKLLGDPTRAPSKNRKSFEKMAQNWEGIGVLPCVLFEDRDAVDIWLSRIHGGEQDGIGRRKWNADQSARHSGKNKVALAVLDYAKENDLISAKDRKGKLTTVQRYLGNQSVCKAMGIDVSDPKSVRRTYSKEDFDLLLTNFLDDLCKGQVHSRSNKDDFEAYARELQAVSGQSGQQIPPEPLDTPDMASKPKKRTSRPSKPKTISYLPHDDEIEKALDDLGEQKLPRLYNSICSIKLQSHTPLLLIGVWAFLESLSSKAGRDVETSFPAYFGQPKLKEYGLDRGRKGNKAIFEPLKRISDSGNVTKHDGTAAFFNGEQLANDLETLKNLILKCIEEAKNKF